VSGISFASVSGCAAYALDTWCVGDPWDEEVDDVTLRKTLEARDATEVPLGDSVFSLHYTVCGTSDVLHRTLNCTSAPPLALADFPFPTLSLPYTFPNTVARALYLTPTLTLTQIPGTYKRYVSRGLSESSARLVCALDQEQHCSSSGGGDSNKRRKRGSSR
jgi:hypothetical protein